MKNKKRALIICPGRGTYNATELGYLQRYHKEKSEWIAVFDQLRSEQNRPKVIELDAEKKFVPSLHTRGENAASLIATCSLCDFKSINLDRYEVVAVTGNSMGWYTSLALSNAVSVGQGARVIDTMGSLAATMPKESVGGQIIYPIVNDDWRVCHQKLRTINQLLQKIRSEQVGVATMSIRLGGYAVIGGDGPSLSYLMQNLPPEGERFPFKLLNHAAFHTPLLESVKKQARELFSPSIFRAFNWPLIDGRGKIWMPYSFSARDLYDYTFGHQVVETYDFTTAISVGLKEFAPDNLIILGPGATLGGAVAQILIMLNWQGIDNKQAFIERQKSDPFIISMGMQEQRMLLT